MEFNRRNVRTLLSIITFTILLMGLVWNIGVVMQAAQKGLGFISFFVIGLSLAFLMNTPLRNIESRLFPPLDRRFGARWRSIRRPFAVLLSVLLVIGLLFAAIFLVIPELVNTFKVIGEQFPKFIDGANSLVQDISEKSGRSLESFNMPKLDWVKIGDAVLGWFQTGASSIMEDTMSAATSFASGVFNVMVGFVVALYVLLNKDKLSAQLKRLLYAYLPEKRVDRFLEIGHLANQAFGNFIGGQFLESIILGILCFLGMTILGFPYAPMVAVLVGVMAFIPMFGAFIGCSVGLFLIIVNQGLLQGIWFLVFFLVLQQIEGNLIYPHVVGKKVSLPGLWVLTGVTLFGNIAGIMGMLVSVPLTSLIYTLVKQGVNRRTKAPEAEPHESGEPLIPPDANPSALSAPKPAAGQDKGKARLPKNPPKRRNKRA